MHVASLELCKKLLELSNWGQSDKWWVIAENYQLVRDYDDEGEPVCPAYDLGYLLRKLPQHSSVESSYKHKSYLVRWDPGPKGYPIEVGAGTPEDAACKLAIELFKQGVLKKEGV